MLNQNWKAVESLNKPLEIDCTLSESGVYVRKNIKEIQADDEQIKYTYDETVLSNEYRYDILDMEEYKAKLLEDFKASFNEYNEKILAEKQFIETSKGSFSIKTPTYDFIFCLMCLKDLPTGIPDGKIRLYDGTPVPAMTQAEIQQLYFEYLNSISELDVKFTKNKKLIQDAQNFDELFSIEIFY